ncbi:NUDIX hydrolase [Halobaculum lipolyticum]|uniref:NUDIX domain-containing protein n=1 Tax=Halobaculum lipolyticum TaxID=3032001 RepID=A0ABD5WBR6_9EURY|nr:NUDIX domain-containing protein [Halobaculum sp. DT31]
MDEQFLEATISIRGVIRRPDGSVLVVRRASDDGWELPGGRIHRNESVRACLAREVAEETGLDVSVREPVEATAWQNRSGRDRFAVYYRCTTDATPVTLSDEHTDAEWVAGAPACDRLSDPQAAATARAVSADD